MSHYAEERKEQSRIAQVGGDHYESAIQPFDYIRANDLGFFEGNIVKYITRYKKKNGLEDLLKAKHYMEELINDYGAKTNR